MKGYLQRMAASAVRPQSGIHPLVGSIYAGRAFADAGSGLHEEERWTPSPQPVGEQRDARIEPDASPFRKSARSEVAQRGSEPPANAASHRDAQRPPFHPLLAAAESESAESSGDDSAADG